MEEKEIWKPIIIWKSNIMFNYTGLYEVSNLGNIRSVDRIDGENHFRKSQPIHFRDHKKVYYRVGLRNNTKKQNVFFVHRILWESFIGKIPESMEINHLDENGHNNFLYINEDGSIDLEKSNLELTSRKANNTYGNRIKNASSKLEIPICQYNLEGVFIKEWKSTTEVERVLGYKKSSINSCLKGRSHSSHGYVWRYKEKAG